MNLTNKNTLKKISLKQQGITGQPTLTKIHLVSTRFNLIWTNQPC